MKYFARSFSTSLKLGYSAQTAVSASKIGVQNDVKLTRMTNGLLVGTQENYSPVARVAVLFNAGSRREDHINSGITHYIRNLAMMSSKRATGFGISRNIQQIGGNLSCTTTREHVIYTVEFLRDKADIALENLAHVSTAPAFKHWEVSDILPKLKFDLQHLENCPQTKLAELIHQAAYRHSLGNSLYVPKHQIGKITVNQLEDFVSEHYCSKNAVVLGLGVDHDELNHFGKKLFLNAGKQDAPSQLPSNYYSGELREDTGSPLTYVTVVTEGLALNEPDLVPLTVLQHLIGMAPHTKYPTASTNNLYKSAFNVARSPFAVSCVNSSYTDSGLFGLNLVCGSKDVNQVLKAAVNVMGSFAKGKITAEDITRGKNNVKATISFFDESAHDFINGLGQEVMLTGKASTLKELHSAVNKVTLEDVVRVAKKVITGKPSMAAIGDLSNTPYMDELFSH